ncbi:NADH dehydrogenase (ubiquinone) complex I, assembly factor 6 isoform X1 [Erythrolamprus reginae]|uniref:NADH dehydrogenase (ubiquinone) complex I, assembly factor 6 isoform X1 n=1 Tax=Erythrolamprus reginae TaxID=121349 RepID=UPI00396D009A
MSRRRLLTDAELEELVNTSDSEDDIPDENVSEEEDHISDWESNDENSDSEVEYEEEHDTQTTSQMQEIHSKNKDLIWNLQPSHADGLPTENIIKATTGPTTYAISRISDIRSAFALFLNTTILNILIQMTNIEGQQVYGDKWHKLDVTALNAYIGLLLLAGVYKSYGEATKSLWNPETGRHIFRATMSLERFHEISRVLRFDNKTDRSERRAKDKLAPIRTVWNKWVEILPQLYNVGEAITVDQQLLGFRGWCPFRQYIPSKPAKYVIKVWTLCDSKSSYVQNAQVYTGRNPGERPEKNQGMQVVLDLTHALKGQNVTCGSFFTSYQLGQMLQKRHLTMLGSIRKNDPELPQGILSKREVYSSTFYFNGDTTVVSYVPPKNKQVILMSTMHHDNAISNREDKKPDMILDYNATKGAVNTLEQAISTYTCKCKTNRWPMIMFYNILDVSAYNAFVLWREIDPNWNRSKLHKRRMFIEELGKSLVRPYIETRKVNPRIEGAAAILKSVQQHAQKRDSAASTSTATSQKRRRCRFCPSSCDNKTNVTCAGCAKYVCKGHVFHYCAQCKNE